MGLRIGPVALTVPFSSFLSSGTGSWFCHCEFHFEMGFKVSVLYNPATGLQALVCPRASTPQGLHFRSTACSKAGRRWTPPLSRDQTGPVSGQNSRLPAAAQKVISASPHSLLALPCTLEQETCFSKEFPLGGFHAGKANTRTCAWSSLRGGYVKGQQSQYP